MYSKYTNACCYTNGHGTKIVFNDYAIFESTCLNLNPADPNRPIRDGAWFLAVMLDIRREISIIMGRISKSGQQRPWSAELWLNFTTFSSLYLKYVFSVFDGNRANLNALYSELGKVIVPAHASDTGMRPAASSTPSTQIRSTSNESIARRKRRDAVKERKKAVGAKALEKLPLGNKRPLPGNADVPDLDDTANLQAQKRPSISEPSRQATMEETMAHNAAFTQQRSLLELLIDKGTAADKESSLDFIRQHAFVGVIGQSSLPHNRVVPIVPKEPEINFEDSYNDDLREDHYMDDNYHHDNEGEVFCCVVGKCIYAPLPGSDLAQDFMETCCEVGPCLNVCYRECGDIINESRICCQCRMR